MNVTIVGSGYVGLVSGACFADSGNHVTCVDNNERKIQVLRQGSVPIFEPGLTELIQRNVKAGRLAFTTDLAGAVKQARIIFLAVGTPQREDGSADLSAIWAVADQIAPHLLEDAIVVTKSTVPVGTNQRLYDRLRQAAGREVDVASNPEFLKEGAAIEDFTRPDRVVVGVRSPQVAETLHRLYKPFLRTDHPFLVMSPESAELTKYVANALLATKISFINQMANVCEHFAADINDVRRGIGHDRRIGFAFLFPGVGYGGSCFPKDVRAMIDTCREIGIEARILEAVDWVNERQKLIIPQKLREHFRDIDRRTIAVWGLAFKPKTDDVREAPSLILIRKLLQWGAHVRVHDPEAMRNVEELFGDQLTYCEDPMQALAGAEALAIMTEWAEFRNPDFAEMASHMREKVIFDGRNLYDLELMQELGWTYYSIGRPPVVNGRTGIAKPG